MTRLPIPYHGSNEPRHVGGLVHSDFCGPMPTESIQGHRCMVTYIDDASNFVHVAFLKEKSEQLQQFIAFDKAMEKQFDTPIRILLFDGGGGYSGKAAIDYRKSRGIWWKRSAPRTPQQNGKAEPMNRTLIEMAI